VRAASRGCYGTKPGHPAAADRARFVEEVSDLAIKAEQQHGVPAAALVAIAIAESGYGCTGIAVQTNNLFTWKAGRSAAAAGKAYVAPCERQSKKHQRFLVFRSRAESFEVVAARLASFGPYRTHTAPYVAARDRGENVEAAVDDWLEGTQRYSRRPAYFVATIRRIMNSPADTRSPNHLYRLSAPVRGAD
jgi:flagellum-specific peptidoglycan hydrolase FlgJ